MRQIVLDTETTGLDWKTGDRLIEIAGVEIIDRKLTGRHYHVYVNPQRDIDAGAVAVHGITLDFLADKPLFKDVADEFSAFVAGSELVIHNAAFDVGFLNNELGMLGKPVLTAICPSVIDTLKLAKEQNPGKKASLNALCSFYDIDNTHRTLHGALLDAELLADVYINLTRGQEALLIDLGDVGGPGEGAQRIDLSGFDLPVLCANAQEAAAHDEVLAQLDKASGGKTVWRRAPDEVGRAGI